MRGPAPQVARRRRGSIAADDAQPHLDEFVPPPGIALVRRLLEQALGRAQVVERIAVVGRHHPRDPDLPAEAGPRHDLLGTPSIGRGLPHRDRRIVPAHDVEEVPEPLLQLGRGDGCRVAGGPLASDRASSRRLIASALA